MIIFSITYSGRADRFCNHLDFFTTRDGKSKPHWPKQKGEVLTNVTKRKSRAKLTLGMAWAKDPTTLYTHLSCSEKWLPRVLVSCPQSSQEERNTIWVLLGLFIRKVKTLPKPSTSLINLCSYITCHKFYIDTPDCRIWGRESITYSASKAGGGTEQRLWMGLWKPATRLSESTCTAPKATGTH